MEVKAGRLERHKALDRALLDQGKDVLPEMVRFVTVEISGGTSATPQEILDAAGVAIRTEA